MAETPRDNDPVQPVTPEQAARLPTPQAAKPDLVEAVGQRLERLFARLSRNLLSQPAGQQSRPRLPLASLEPRRPYRAASSEPAGFSRPTTSAPARLSGTSLTGLTPAVPGKAPGITQDGPPSLLGDTQ